MTPEQYNRINELLAEIARELDLVEDVEATPEDEAARSIQRLEEILALLRRS